MIIDSWFDNYLGIVSLIRVMHGAVRVGDKIQVMSSGKAHTVEMLGFFSPKRETIDVLETGEVGYLVAGVKDIHAAPVGDTLTDNHAPAAHPLAGFKRIQPRVYAGLFPNNADCYAAFRDALGKLSLNDASLFYEPESSGALGLGFRCGFLGMLHMEIIQQRLEREYGLTLMITAPTVPYQVTLTNGNVILVDNPSKLPPPNEIDIIEEAIVKATILVPQDYIGAVMTLSVERRGEQKDMQYLGNQVSLVYELPMNEIMLDFFDRLKSLTRGYGSLDYQFTRFRAADLVKLDILINGERIDACASIIHKDRTYHQGRALVAKLRKIIPRQMFDVAIQAAIGNHVIARETVKALRKNVTAKCYGGDISRKRKLLEKQKAGKKRMKQFGKVSIPQDAFFKIFKAQDSKE